MRAPATMFSILCAAALFVSSAAAAQRRCPAAEPPVRLEFAQPRPTFDTLPLEELRRMSRDEEHERILGLYKAELRSSMRIEYATRDDGGSACIALREVIVDMQLAERRIYLARELKRGTCRYDATLAHEQQHARIDDTVFARELPVLKQAMARAAAENGAVGPFPLSDVATHRDDISERLQRVFRQELDRINEVRRREQGAIDTPESYRREAARCPGE
jgi:hypothetical protein